jgi:hypothetical protein
LSSERNNNLLVFLVFSFFLIINIATNGGHFDAYDGIETFLVTESMVLKHSAKFYPDVPSVQKLHFDVHQTVVNNEITLGEKLAAPNTPLVPMYIYRSLLLSGIAVPIYYAALFFSVSPIHAVALFVNPVILSLISVVIFCFSLEIHRSRKIAFALSLIFGVCSFAWSYTTTLLPQPLQALLLISSVFFIYKAAHSYSLSKQIIFAGSAGILLGFSLLAHPDSAIIIPAFVVYSIFSMKHNKKDLIAFLVMLGMAICFVGLLNYFRFGLFTEFGYGGQALLSVHSGWEGLVGLLMSPGKGIVFYFPVVILLPLALKYMYKENKGLTLLFIYVIISNWLFFGSDDYFGLHSWAGDVGWGPRYMVPVLPFITVAFGALFIRLKNRLFLKFSILTLCAVSFFVSLMGTIVWYQYGLGYGWEREGLWQYDHIKFPYHNLTVSSWEPLTWFPKYSPIILNTKVLMSDYLSKVLQAHSDGMSKAQVVHAIGWPFMGLAPCPIDSYVYCEAGILPILFIVWIESGVAISILVKIHEKPIFKNYAKVRRQE